MSCEAKKSQRPLSELFTRNTTKKLANAQAKLPRQLAPSYYSPNTFLLHRINKPTMVEIGATVLKYWPLCACLCAHIQKTIPIPLVLKFNTFIVPSINIESISPTMKRCYLSSFSSSLSYSHLPGHLV